jgi:hypothetical protein
VFSGSLEEPAVNQITRRSNRYARAKSTYGTSREKEADPTSALVGVRISGLRALHAHLPSQHKAP